MNLWVAGGIVIAILYFTNSFHMVESAIGASPNSLSDAVNSFLASMSPMGQQIINVPAWEAGLILLGAFIIARTF